MDCCYGNHFASPRTIEVNYLFGAMLPKTRLYQGAGIKTRNQTRQAKTCLVNREQKRREKIQEIKFSGHTAKPAFLLAS